MAMFLLALKSTRKINVYREITTPTSDLAAIFMDFPTSGYVSNCGSKLGDLENVARRWNSGSIKSTS